MVKKVRFVRKKKTYKKVGDNIKKYVKRTLDDRIEDKWILLDYATLNPVSATNGAGFLVNYGPAMVQGTSSNNRLGDKIRIKTLDTIIHLSGTDAIHNTAFRVLLIRHKNAENLALVTSDFMEAAAGVGLSRPLLPKTELNERVEIMYDQIHHLEATGNVTGDVNHKIIRIRKFKLNMVTKFGRGLSTGNATDIESNGLWIWVFGMTDNGTATSRGQVRDLQSTLTFEDA